MWRDLFWTSSDKRLECLDAVLSQLIIIHFTELYNERYNTLEMFTDTVAGCTTEIDKGTI